MENNAPLALIFDLAREYRVNSSLSLADNLRKNIAILAKLSCLLPEVSFNKYLETFRVLDSKEIVKRGKSNDLVYFLYDELNQLKYMLKGFLFPFHLKSKFLCEVSALDFLQHLHLEMVAPLQIRDMNYIIVDEKPYGFILENVAAGIKMNQFKEIDERAFYILGKALASMRPINSKVSMFPKEQAMRLRAAVKEDKVMDALLEEILTIPIQLSYLHGDANLGNVFYDSKKQKITFIDTFKLYYSVDSQLNPLSEGSEDLYRIESYIQRRAIGIVPNEKIKRWLDLLFEGYFEICPMPHPTITQFYRRVFNP